MGLFSLPSGLVSSDATEERAHLYFCAICSYYNVANVCPMGFTVTLSQLNITRVEHYRKLLVKDSIQEMAPAAELIIWKTLIISQSFQRQKHPLCNPYLRTVLVAQELKECGNRISKEAKTGAESICSVQEQVNDVRRDL